MKAINVCPLTLAPGYSGYSPRAIKMLFDGVAVSPILDIDFEKERDQQLARDNMSNMSISGAQEKFSAVVDTFNLGLSTRKQIPANEHLTMQIAAQVYGIRTAANGLCFSSSGQPVYITKRFDVVGGVKDCSQEDFAAILQMTEQGNDSNFKYHGNYAQIADAIRKIIPAWMPQMEQFFKMVVFNYLFGNEDAHMKNFSMVNRGNEFFLAPAYDLINTCVHTQSGSDLGLLGGLSPDIEKSDAYDRTGHPCRLDFERFAERKKKKKKRADMVLSMFMDIPQETYALINRSFLNDKMKRSYKRVIEERKERFVRME